MYYRRETTESARRSHPFALLEREGIFSPMRRLGSVILGRTNKFHESLSRLPIAGVGGAASRNVRSFCQSSDKTDAQLSRSSDSLWSILQRVPRILSDDGLQEGEKLFKAEIVPDIFQAGSLLVHLLNPLLLKYNFDPYDFMEGARAAIIRLVKTVHSEEMARLRAGRGEASADTVAFLQSALCTSLALAATKAPSHVTSQKVVTDVSLGKVHMEFVNTRLVTQDWLFRRIVEFSLTQYVLGLTQDPYQLTRAVRENLQEGEIDASVLRSDRYVPGSVLALVVLHVQYKQTFRLLPHDAAQTEERSGVEDREGRWLFEGVISGQSELRWVVRSYDHLGMLEDSLLP
eukprot:gene33132-40077_t